MGAYRRRPSGDRRERRAPRGGAYGGRKTGWRYSWLTGVMYGNIPVGLIFALVVAAIVVLVL